MFLYVLLWAIFGFFSFGVVALRLLFLKWFASNRPRSKSDEAYQPKVSLIVPTYNESKIIRFKLRNISMIDYPPNLMQIIFVDGNSQDGTAKIIGDYNKQHPEINVQLLVENERRGKSSALNYALKHCDGEIVVISDADCLWKPSILREAIPYLSDPEVGAGSGPKVLLNPAQSWVTKTEELYLKTLNTARLGESKIGSTLFFEGGFSAYKRKALSSFDPYNTGSDDNGTVIQVLENDKRTLFIPEAEFYTIFPIGWKEKVSLKIRRASQLLRVLTKYVTLLSDGKLKGARKVVILNLFIHFFAPIFFVLFCVLSFVILLHFPLLSLTFLTLAIPKVRIRFFDAVVGFSILVLAMILNASNRRFTLWSQPESRALVNEELLAKHGLV